MAFKKYARATVLQPNLKVHDWFQNKSRFSHESPVRLASKIPITDYKVDDHIFSHATIISSVDTLPSSINSRGWEFRLKPDTIKYVNANGDCWERRLLLATFKTFIGGYNFLEHIQIPDLSKGAIIDAYPRDLGETVYIDILVATERKHEDLCEKILSNKLNTLSMGAIVKFCICTYCGNVAYDDTELCEHIGYQKGQLVTTSEGQAIMAELCGHYSDPTSNNFIEASWVETPAFFGAVKRNVLTPPKDAKIFSLPQRDIAAEASMSLRKVANKQAKGPGSFLDFLNDMMGLYEKFKEVEGPEETEVSPNLNDNFESQNQDDVVTPDKTVEEEQKGDSSKEKEPEKKSSLQMAKLARKVGLGRYKSMQSLVRVAEQILGRSLSDEEVSYLREMREVKNQ